MEDITITRDEYKELLLCKTKLDLLKEGLLNSSHLDYSGKDLSFTNVEEIMKMFFPELVYARIEVLRNDSNANG